MYETEKEMLGKSFVVSKEWRIGQCKMKKGDLLTVIDYGSGMVSHYVVFRNSRLRGYKFTTGTRLFQQNTEPKNSSFFGVQKPPS